MTTLRIHNTLTQKTEDFAPIDPGHVRMYVCGPTVYDFAHLGNARPVVVFDILFRLLSRLYPKVTYVRNVTDVDDKIIAAAKEKGESIGDLTQRTYAQYKADMGALGALDPTVEPKATQHIGDMIAIIQVLMEKGNAYEAEGHVLFHVPSMPDYGMLSKRSRDDMVMGARVEVAPYKRDPADFVLWKPSTDEQPGWESPWGRGRPGWHIECSAMSAKHLGIPFDIHGGGIDLVFPHHENEIAQTRCSCGSDSMSRFFMHNGHLGVEGQKMSKSLGNFITVHQLLDEGIPGEALRYYLMTAHYSQPFDFTREGLTQARAALDKLYIALRGVDANAGADIPDRLLNALCDDLNTPKALAELHKLAKEANKSGTVENKSRLLAAGRFMGLFATAPEEWLRGTAEADGLSDADIEKMITERLEAKAEKNFVRADAIRKELTDAGLILEDNPTGTTWRRK
ncbi:MAG TPA: cysteine--tRNA ligase [Rhodospirillaceae bacterium]|nr:MAG: cysteine--tRNA ligase [Alphaproteobacteria bacterium GWF2_58_20]HAU29322.1 cysteine--tRNA ligase [Rhodospirillaceae bacterium]